MAPPVPVDAPSVVSLPVAFAEQKNHIVIDPVDVGPEIVDGVQHERGVFDRGNWRIVAQCERMVGNTLTAGVIKDDEFRTIQEAEQGQSIADNSLSSLLHCPS